MSFDIIKTFENKIAQFFGSPFAVAIDCCTHGVELSLRLTNATKIYCPKRTYISIPNLSTKMGIGLEWKDENWSEYYYLTDRVIDAAVLWRSNSYIEGTLMSISFQYKKHLSLGRGGVILVDNKEDYIELKKMSYDGRLPDIPWREQNISSMGYHYYMTPETAQKGVNKLESAINTTPKKWSIDDWPDLTKMDIYRTKLNNNFIDPYLQTR